MDLFPATIGLRAPRLDVYAAVHKALRLYMGHTLARVGRLDPCDRRDEQEGAATLAQLDELLELCRAHLVQENNVLHTAIEARLPGGSGRIGRQHDEQLETIAGLQVEAAALRAHTTPAAAHRLYRHLAVWVGEHLAHMNAEETQLNQALWASYSDEELLEIQQRLLDAIPADQLVLLRRWLLPALPAAELAHLPMALRQ